MLRFPDPTHLRGGLLDPAPARPAGQFLREENRILRAKLPDRISTTPEERSRLLRFGVPLGDAVEGLISIVKPETFARWVRKGPGRRRVGKTGRPRKPEEIRVPGFSYTLGQILVAGQSRIRSNISLIGSNRGIVKSCG